MDTNALTGIDVNSDFDFQLVDTYTYNKDFSEIEVIRIVQINTDNFLKLDMIIIGEYSFRGIDFTNNLLPLILSFNNLQDITEVKIGTILKLPNLEQLVGSIELIDFDNIEFDDNIPGVNTRKEISTGNSKNKNTKTNTAQPKLKITLPEVVYNSETGIITY